MFSGDIYLVSSCLNRTGFDWFYSAQWIDLLILCFGVLCHKLVGKERGKLN